MANFGPLMAEISWRLWGTAANFNTFRVLALLLHQRRSMEVNQTLHNVWLSSGLVYYTACPRKNGQLKYNGVVFEILGKHN